MARNFISNKTKQKTLAGRLNNIIGISKELRWLVGFFYFSGWTEVYKKLKQNNDVTIKLLVGLQVGQHLGRIFEHDHQDAGLSNDDQFLEFMESMGFALNNEQQDTREFYEQVRFFMQMILDDRLVIRKTREPNHAKLYLFEMNEKEQENHNIDGYLITGSSNLTRSGLKGQHEFNVEIKDYGYPEGVAYFEELWETAIPITEHEQRRKQLVEFVQYGSQAAGIMPFEAYVLVLKTYLDLQNQKQIKPLTEEHLEKIGYKKFSYQIDAVNDALGKIEQYNGVIIADVVGLGKSVIASLLARDLGLKGVVICPPGLIGSAEDATGWRGYTARFDLPGWNVISRSVQAMERLAEDIDHQGIEVVIVDEAHSFRNEDTTAHEMLNKICKGRKVILLTATPFNNSPADIFALLKLFLVPGMSPITFNDDLEAQFRRYTYRYSLLSYILKNHNNKDPDKRDRAISSYEKIIGEPQPIEIAKVREASAELSREIKEVINPVVIRRNRIDLLTDRRYKPEMGELPVVEPPVRMFYKLNKKQSDFYDKVVGSYFAENGVFKGAIYQPFTYEQNPDTENLDAEGNRAYQQQRNLYDFMKRLLVKRFESSFGAFAKSIDRFIQVHELVLNFIDKTGNYIMDRSFMEKIYEYDEDEIEEKLHEYANNLLNRKTPKNNSVYVVDDFVRKDDFINDIEADKTLFEKLKNEVEQLGLVDEDPKLEGIINEVHIILTSETDGDHPSKVILFSEYVDTVKHLETRFRESFPKEVLICDGTITGELDKALQRNFNGQRVGDWHHDYRILITSDKLAEGYNLNRAGDIINYDIPWNPTRVIQRVGRINRIGNIVHKRLRIYNYFPSETGAEHVRSEEIARQKMFMIHNALGEDARIFHPDEEPSASGLYDKINAHVESEDEENLVTKVRNLYAEIEEKHPEVIERISKMPSRTKTGKHHPTGSVNVLRRKGLSLFSQQATTKEEEDGIEIKTMPFQDLLKEIECKINTPRIEPTETFWPAYEKVKRHKETVRLNTSELSVELRAHNNIKAALKMIDASEEELRAFLITLRKDAKQYHTLSKYTWRRLASANLDKSPTQKNLKTFIDEVKYVRKTFGADYLDKVLERVSDQGEEIIIAVENVERK